MDTNGNVKRPEVIDKGHQQNYEQQFICHMDMFVSLMNNNSVPLIIVGKAGPCLNIKTVFPRYGDSHVKDKTVGETVLSLTWESLYW